MEGLAYLISEFRRVALNTTQEKTSTATSLDYKIWNCIESYSEIPAPVPWSWIYWIIQSNPCTKCKGKKIKLFAAPVVLLAKIV